jgi:hypothetical protein
MVDGSRAVGGDRSCPQRAASVYNSFCREQRRNTKLKFLTDLFVALNDGHDPAAVGDFYISRQRTLHYAVLQRVYKGLNLSQQDLRCNVESFVGRGAIAA